MNKSLENVVRPVSFAGGKLDPNTPDEILPSVTRKLSKRVSFKEAPEIVEIPQYQLDPSIEVLEDGSGSYYINEVDTITTPDGAIIMTQPTKGQSRRLTCPTRQRISDESVESYIMADEKVKFSNAIQDVEEEMCNRNVVPWPIIIVAILGVGIVIYTGAAQNVIEGRRIFGVVLILLWTIMWCLILWGLWKYCYYRIMWWVSLVPVIMMVLFFILVIVLNIGSG